MHELSSKLQNYLMKYFASRVRKLREDGVEVTLTWREFMGMITKKQVATLEAAIAENRLKGLQDDQNPYALMLTWAGYEFHSVEHRVFSKDTAVFCSRQRSKIINRPKRGQKLGARHRASISDGLSGKPKSEDHRQNISDAKKGVKIAGWSEERKAARKAQIAAKKAHANRLGI